MVNVIILYNDTLPSRDTTRGIPHTLRTPLVGFREYVLGGFSSKSMNQTELKAAKQRYKGENLDQRKKEHKLWNSTHTTINSSKRREKKSHISRVNKHIFEIKPGSMS